MSKIIKRILSMLAVLALVLTMAPAGILAVETKAESTLPAEAQAKIAHGAEVKAWADSINAAVKADTSKDDGYVKVNKLAEAKTCPVCGQTNITWTRASGWNNTTNGSSSARKYSHLVVDRNMSAELDFVNLQAYNTVCILWLDGYTVTMKDYVYKGGDTDYTETDNKADGSGADVYLLGWQSQLNIMGNAKMISNSEKLPMFHFANTAAGAGTTLNLYGGTYRHNKSSSLVLSVIRNGNADGINCPDAKVNIYNDVVIGPENPQEPNTTGATNYCNVRWNGGTFNMYGGTIQNGYSGVGNQGWNVMLLGSGVFNMYGGTIKGGSGTNGATGCNVHVRSTFNMYGGELLNGKTTSYQAGGANLYVGVGSTGGAAPAKIPTANIYGGTIKGGTNINSRGHGGNINVGGAQGSGAYDKVGYGILNISGTALITDGSNASGYGGNIAVNMGATLNMTGGTVQNGKATNGGNIGLYKGATANISGGVITEGKATSGGNIYVNGDTLVISGNTQITNGKNTAGYASYGGNIYMLNAASGTSIGGTVSGGTAINGGNIYMLSGTADISATVSAGKARFGANIYVLTNDTGKTAGSVTFSGGSSSGGILDKLGADATPYAKDVYVYITGAGAGMNVILKNDFSADWINFAKSAEKNILTVDPSWTGAAIFENGANYVGGAISDGYASAAFTGQLTNARGHVVPIIADGNGGLKLVDFVVIDEEEKQTGYATAEEALAAADKQPTKRIVTRTDFAMNGEEVVVDAINDVTVTGTGKIFGMDYDNNGYKTSNGWITAPEGVVQPEATVKGIRYVALKNAFEEHADAWSFHRVEIELTNVTVNVDKAGIYYKAQYKFDEVVKGRVDSYGVLLNLNEAPTEESLATSSSELGGYADATLVAASHGVYGIFKDGKESNLADGKTKVFGNPYLAINTTGEELEEYPMFTAAEAIGKSLADSMELANEKWDQLTPNDQTALNEFVNKWNALGAWETDLIAKLTNFTIA